MASKEPKDGTRHAIENPSPGIENPRIQLERAGESTEHDAILGQAEAISRGRVGDRARTIVDLVARRQLHQRFGVALRMLKRRDDAIADEIIDE